MKLSRIGFTAFVSVFLFCTTGGCAAAASAKILREDEEATTAAEASSRTNNNNNLRGGDASSLFVSSDTGETVSADGEPKKEVHNGETTSTSRQLQQQMDDVDDEDAAAAADTDTDTRSLVGANKSKYTNYGGYTGRACRKNNIGNPGYKKTDFWLYESTNLQWCFDKCTAMGKQCQAFQYYDGSGDCELWYQHYGFYATKYGYYCFYKMPQ